MTKKTQNDKNTVVMLNLDRPRKVRFGHKALKMLGARTDKNVNEMAGNVYLEEIEKVLNCGILQDERENGETLKLEDMEDLLDQAESYGDIMQAMNLALDKAFQETEKQ